MNDTGTTVLASLPRPWRARVGRLDRVALATAAIFATLALADSPQFVASAEFLLRSAATVAPFLLASVLAAAWTQAAGADWLIARAFRGRPVRMVALAAAAGALSPFCSCGVIPIIAALLAMGVPLAPVMAFWLASPLMDPAMFLMTAGTLGPGFAIAKTASAIGIGLAGGFGVLALHRAGRLGDALRPELAARGDRERFRAPKASWRFWTDDARRDLFRRQFATKALFLGKWMAFAFVLESLMLAYVPAGWIASLAGGDGVGAVAFAALAGVPAYLNGYAALPLASGLMQQGMSQGAAMAFLLGGGVTSIPAMIAVWATARPPVFAAYLGFALAGSIAAGLVYGLA